MEVCRRWLGLGLTLVTALSTCWAVGLKQITYYSAATHPETLKLDELLLDFRRENKKHINITGLLLFRKNTFLQTIEGNYEDVDRLILNIMKDQRHRLITILQNEPILQRHYSKWDMYFEIPDFELPKVPEFAALLTEMEEEGKS